MTMRKKDEVKLSMRVSNGTNVQNLTGIFKHPTKCLIILCS